MNITNGTVAPVDSIQNKPLFGISGCTTYSM